MFRRYLLKRKFWPVKDRNGQTMFITHNAPQGGIYAYLEHQADRNGVRIVTGGKESFFDNFDQLDEFLDNLRRQDKTQAKLNVNSGAPEPGELFPPTFLKECLFSPRFSLNSYTNVWRVVFTKK